MQKRGKTIVYFDNSNIFQCQRQFGWRIDVEKLQAVISRDGEIWQVHFFAAVTDPPRYSQTNFYRMLKEKLRWETTIFPLGSKTLRCDSCHHTKRVLTEKGIDVAIATKLLTHAINRAFETAILVSGDKDYLETVRVVKNLGMRVEIVSFRQSLSRELANESSAPILYLDDIRNEIELTRPDMEAEQMQLTDTCTSPVIGADA
jgi:uncharacterized LabA/DUF88 family protein